MCFGGWKKCKYTYDEESIGCACDGTEVGNYMRPKRASRNFSYSEVWEKYSFVLTFFAH